MTPLVDVVLVLLIIFMVVTPLMTKQVTVRVVGNGAAANAPASDERPPQVIISAEGTVKVNQVDVDIPSLEQAVRAGLVTGKTKLVQLQASDRAPYEQVVRVLDILRGAGARDIAMVTSQS